MENPVKAMKLEWREHGSERDWANFRYVVWKVVLSEHPTMICVPHTCAHKYTDRLGMAPHTLGGCTVLRGSGRSSRWRR